MMRRLLIWGVFILSLALSVGDIMANSNYLFRHIDSNMGLSSSNVKCILQDSCGFMWFGTKNGLNRYDGVFMRQLNCFDFEKNQGNNNIGALYEDANRNLWVGTDRGVYIYNSITDRFKAVDTKDSKTGAFAENWVQTIVGDAPGSVWVLLPDQGVFHYYGGKVDFFNITPKSTFKSQFPSNIYADKNGDVWVCTAGAGFYKFNKEQNVFNKVITEAGEALDNIHFATIDEADDNSLLLASDKGTIYQYNKAANTMSIIRHAADGKVYLRCIKSFDDEIWLGTQKGIYIVDKNTGKETLLLDNPLNRFSLSDNAIYYIYKSNSGDAWVGTIFGGVNYMARNKFHFEVYGLASALTSRRVRGMAQTSNGMIWFGTEDGGLCSLNPSTKKVSHISATAGQGDIILDVMSFNDKVYASFNGNGISVLSSDGTPIENLRIPGNDNSIYSYLKDSKGNEWMGTGSALYRRDAGSADFKHISDTGYDWIFDLYEGSDGTIWIATMGNGLWRYTPANGMFKSYTYSEKAPNGLRSNSISSIVEDHRGNIWLSTDRGGISRYNKDKDDFTSYGVAEGLPDDVAYDILEDRKGNLWFGTNMGLVKFNPTSMSIKAYSSRDGIVGNQFNYHSALKASNGLFFFGGIEGIVAFDPEKEERQVAPASVYFTKLSIGSKECIVGGEDSPLTRNIMFTDRIELPHDQASFSLNVVSPNFGVADDGNYTYRLLPVNDNWIPISNNNISFSNLAPGKYQLQVKVSNHGGYSMQELTIVILSPWWLSVWAYIVYFILIVLAFVAWFLWYRSHKNKQMLERQELFAAKKDKELYSSKVKFFTEIAHEIRTPLTLIDAPLEAVEELGIDDSRVNHYIKIVRQNTKRLLDLTGDLLDFQKIDSHKLTIKYENVDVVSLVNETIDRFEPTIQLREKELVRKVNNDEVIVSTDKEAVTKVLSNLFNNALKYSRHRIEVSLEIDDENFTIRVVSDGEKISEADSRRIFERFYQLDNRKNGETGVGIGLSLATSLVTLLNGKLELEDTADSTNCFKVTLPINKESIEKNNDTTVDTSDYVMEEESNLSKESTNGNTVLLVEDNATMREFIAEQLVHSFTVEKACNGKEALEVLNSTHVDIIVTDIMMPEMDGFELCKAVKENIDMSHIPVVFITAKNDLDSKIRGLQYGAEGYIEKPFSVKYFKRLISSLLDNRRREREAFSKKPFFSVENMQTNKADEEFMNKVVKIIEEHICEDNFNVEAMADIFCMSRSSLLRKIKTLFNLLPVELIRLIKLKKAAELIQEGKYRIGDICYMVGISSPSYFSKLFFKQFGITPKDFEKQCQKKENNIDVHEKLGI